MRYRDNVFWIAKFAKRALRWPVNSPTGRFPVLFPPPICCISPPRDCINKRGQGVELFENEGESDAVSLCDRNIEIKREQTYFVDEIYYYSCLKLCLKRSRLVLVDSSSFPVSPPFRSTSSSSFLFLSFPLFRDFDSYSNSKLFLITAHQRSRQSLIESPGAKYTVFQGRKWSTVSVPVKLLSYLVSTHLPLPSSFSFLPRRFLQRSPLFLFIPEIFQFFHTFLHQRWGVILSSPATASEMNTKIQITSENFRSRDWEQHRWWNKHIWREREDWSRRRGKS